MTIAQTAAPFSIFSLTPFVAQALMCYRCQVSTEAEARQILARYTAAKMPAEIRQNGVTIAHA